MVAPGVPHRRPFRFGVGPGAIALGSAGTWRDFARRIEDLGYATLSVGDHLVGGHGPVAAIAAAAEATTRLRVGALTFCNDYRHPVVLAQEAATLDLLSDGRLELGIGAGWMRADYERAGIPLDPAGERVERLAEAITVIKGCFAGEPLTFDGAHYRIDGHVGRPAPVQRPHPPILVGGAGPKVLTLAARKADIVGLNVNLRAGHLGPEMGPSATPRRHRGQGRADRGGGRRARGTTRAPGLRPRRRRRIARRDRPGRRGRGPVARRDGGRGGGLAPPPRRQRRRGGGRARGAPRDARHLLRQRRGRRRRIPGARGGAAGGQVKSLISPAEPRSRA